MIGHGREQAPHELAVIDRQIDAVQQVVAVAGHRHDGFRPAERGKEHVDCGGPLPGQFQFLVGRAHAAGPDWIDVDEQPTAGEDVPVGSGLRRAALEAVRGPGQKVGLDGIERDVDAGRQGRLVEFGDQTGGRLDRVVREVAAHGAGVGRAASLQALGRADLEHVPRLHEQVEEAGDLAGDGGSHQNGISSSEIGPCVAAYSAAPSSVSMRGALGPST